MVTTTGSLFINLCQQEFGSLALRPVISDGPGSGGVFGFVCTSVTPYGILPGTTERPSAGVRVGRQVRL